MIVALKTKAGMEKEKEQNIERFWRNGGDNVRDIQRYVHRVLRDSAGLGGGSIRRDLLSFAGRQALLATVSEIGS